MVQENNTAPFLYRPASDGTSPFLFAVPHSGRYYPEDFVEKSPLTTEDLRRSEDAFVDKLFESVPSSSASLLVATHARAYVDLNRAENELDPAMFSPKLDSSLLDVSYRVQAGLGVIPQYVAEDTPIYHEPLPAREAEKRLKLIHRPYHQKLSTLLDNL
ncbi:MAG: N-formylglutamate amidohydrolase, partial [Kordiimonas sp.]